MESAHSRGRGGRLVRLVDLTEAEFERFVSEVPADDPLVEAMRRVRARHRELAEQAHLHPMIEQIFRGSGCAGSGT